MSKEPIIVTGDEINGQSIVIAESAKNEFEGKSNYDLRYIIEYTDKKNEAWEQLLKQLGVTTEINEAALILQIAENVLARPGSLKMDKWHCGTSHCLAGWACVLSPIGAEIEKRFDTETASDALLPNYSHLFFSDDKTVLEILKEIVAKNNPND